MSLYSFQHIQISGGSKISTLFGKILFTPNPSKTFTHNYEKAANCHCEDFVKRM